MSPFGLALHVLRLRKGIHQAKLNNSLELDRGRISAWERGIRPAPDDHMIRRLCKVLNADALEEEELLGAARLSSRFFKIPLDSIPEAYPLVHKLAAALPRMSKSDIKILEHTLSELSDSPNVRSLKDQDSAL